jgi:hypothetical protein
MRLSVVGVEQHRADASAARGGARPERWAKQTRRESAAVRPAPPPCRKAQVEACLAEKPALQKVRVAAANSTGRGDDCLQLACNGQNLIRALG